MLSYPISQESPMHDALDAVLGSLRSGFDADGFDVNVESVGDDGVVVVRVGHRPDACEECLIPDDMLGPMLTTAFQRAVPSVQRVGLKHEHLA
jgi:Fe-S cluster biogenesis protein NfuA